MTPIIETKDLTHIYGAGTPFQSDALQQVNFYANRGEFIGIIGHTGSGKSTFIQHLNGLLKPSSGQVLFQGEDIWKDKNFTHQIRFKVGLVFQYPEYQLFEETVYKDIAFGPKNMGLMKRRFAAACCVLRDLWEFRGGSLQEKSPFDLSGGQKRRAAIAGVIAMEPDVFILDEPTAGLIPGAATASSRTSATIRRRRTPPFSWSPIPWRRSHSWPTVARPERRNHRDVRHAARGLLPRGASGRDRPVRAAGHAAFPPPAGTGRRRGPDDLYR